MKRKTKKKTKKELKEWGIARQLDWMKKTTKKFRSENASKAANARWEKYRIEKENH